MRHYLLRLTLALAHDFYDDAPIPMRVVPSDPALFDKQGLILKRQGNRFLIVGEESDPLPEQLTFDVIAAEADVFSVTRHAEWGRVLNLSVPLNADEKGFGPSAGTINAMRNRLERLAQVTVFLGDAPREVTLRFEAVEALWAYHVTGPGSRDDLEVVDPAEDVLFSQHGRKRLPDGSEAQVFRSDRPLPARARPSQKFMLQRPSPFGPETLIPVLPGAGKMFKPIPEEEGAPARLQSDIYVTLW